MAKNGKSLEKDMRGKNKNKTENSTLEISNNEGTSSLVSIADLVKDSFKSIEDRYSSKKKVTGIATGFKIFDELTAGLQKSDLIVIASHPGMGKTSFVLNISLSIAIQGIPVAYFSLDKSKENLTLRILSSEARIDLDRLKGGFLEADDWRQLTAAAGRISDSKLILIDDMPCVNISQIVTQVRRIYEDKGLALIVVDYIQLIQDGNKPKIMDICRSLKELAKEINLPVIAVSQTTSKPRDRFPDRRPMFEDLRENNVYAQTADIIIFIYRDEVYNMSEDNPCKGLAEIIVARHRNGPVGTVRLAFHKEYLRFDNFKPLREVNIKPVGSCH